jgi:HTH-type transcriptional regulator, sugar sensing transcriptional regulator
MQSSIDNLVRLGLKEYEAKIYVALVGLGEANVRSIHEVSGVPRPRVYDVLNSLADKGYISKRQGSPLMYGAVRPDIVITSLKKDFDSAAHDSVKALEELSVKAEQNYSPIWYVHSDWTIHKNLEMLTEGVGRELIVLCFNAETLTRFQGPIASIADNRSVKVLVPRGLKAGIKPLDGVSYYEAGSMKNFFGVNIFEKVFSTPINRLGTVSTLECILVADDNESMLIYSQNGKRMAVVITLPFITCVQSQLFRQMLSSAHKIGRAGDEQDTAGAEKEIGGALEIPK